MKTETLASQLNGQLSRLLKVHNIAVSQPQERMLKLDEVPIGSPFNHPSTNILLCENDEQWDVFVDSDLVYTGEDDKRRQLFQGIRKRGWQSLSFDAKLPSDLNLVIVLVLNQLESPLRRLAPEAIACSFESLPESDERTALDKRSCRYLGPQELSLRGVEPTSSQADLVEQLVETLTRQTAPTCPMLFGPAGVGKTTVARWAARELCDRGAVNKIVEMRCSAICAGVASWPERDERLRLVLDSLTEDRETLVIAEQLELACSRSAVAVSLVSEYLDRGLKMIAIAGPEYRQRSLRVSSQVYRRVECCQVAPPDPDELTDILKRWIRSNRLAANLELSSDVVPLVVQLSNRRAGANPAAAVGLLAAVMNRAAFTGGRCVGPDDVFHLININ